MKDPAPPALHAPCRPPWPGHSRRLPCGAGELKCGGSHINCEGLQTPSMWNLVVARREGPGPPGNTSLWAKGSQALPGQAALTFWSLRHMRSRVYTAAVLVVSLRTRLTSPRSLAPATREAQQPPPRRLGAQPDSPELQLDPPAVQQDGGCLVVYPCDEAERG